MNDHKIGTGEDAPCIRPFKEGEVPSERYVVEGYLRNPFFFDPAIIDQAAEATRKIHMSGKRRAQDLWRRSSAIKALACDHNVLSLLTDLYGRRAIPFQTLSFVKGSEQKPHSDSIHFSSQPERYMCGVWIALEDVDEENGPLVYFPGSHRLPLFSMRDVGGDNYVMNYEPFIEQRLAEGGFERKIAPLKKGEAFLWSANLIHGGAPIVDSDRTRLSLVTHYYFEDCLYITPMREKVDEPHIREIFDIAAGRFVRQQLDGVAVRPSPLVALAARLRNLTRRVPLS